MVNLVDVLKGINWGANIDAAYTDATTLSTVETMLHRIAVWSNQLEIADEGNPALCFLREMQVAMQQIAISLGLCTYKSAAAAARTSVETCLYYSYFRTHQEELATLVRVEKFYVSKSDIVEYHKTHTADFSTKQQVFGLIGELDSWYSKISAVIHGQIPGAWNTHTSIAQIGFNQATHTLALQTVIKAEALIHQILLCTVGGHFWSIFAPDAKKELVKGISATHRSTLGLDLK
jgi:hypothetical protein